MPANFASEDARENLELLCSAATVVAGICRLVGVGPSSASGDGVARGTSLSHRLADCPIGRFPANRPWDSTVPPQFQEWWTHVRRLDGAFILPEDV